MNGRDVDDIRSILARQRESDNYSLDEYQRKLVYRMRTQLIARCPYRSTETDAVKGFVAFANWLGDRGTLERTYPDEAEGGQPLLRTLQMAAEYVSILQSNEFRRVVFNKDNVAYLESWHDWAIPNLESQLNRWRHLPGAALPLRITVDFVPLAVPKSLEKTVMPYGNTSLRFSVTKR